MRTRPLSYQQVTQSTRTRSVETDRASHRAERLTDWDADTSKPDGFVCQLMSAHAPASIIDRFGETSLHESSAGHVTNGDEPGTPGNGCCDLVSPVLPCVHDLGVDGFDTLFLPGSLGFGERVCVLSGQVLPGIDDPIGASDVFTQTQVNADLSMSEWFGTLNYFALQVHVPATACVLGEASGFESPFDRTRQPQAKNTATKVDFIPSYADSR
jgi:hypothetical protein